ncbi:MAG TPA: response regulator [Anaerolineae bacterium]|nr:response regulator [Anaerolineae bacterium]HQH37958.1 response regulator [Anaerolineae bacterium]
MVKVLYVEDEPLQRELVNQLLQLAGIEIQLAESGLEGVEKARQWEPDVILMDIRMPGLNGFDTIEQIRQIPSVADTPVVVLSAWATAQHTARARALGVEWYITKPFNLDDLVSTIMDAYAARADSKH